MSRVFLRSRKWINPKTYYDSGAVQSRVLADESGIDASFAIWDCSRKITLDLSTYDDRDHKHRAAKINILIDELIKVREAMGKAYEYYESVKEENDE